MWTRELDRRDDLLATVADDMCRIVDWWDDDGMTNHHRLVMTFNELMKVCQPLHWPACDKRFVVIGLRSKTAECDSCGGVAMVYQRAKEQPNVETKTV